MAIRFSFTAYAIGLLIFMGCAPPSTYQSPRVLEPREKVLGVGFSLLRFNEEDGEEVAIVPSDLSVYARFGVYNKMDIGFKIFGFPNPDYFDLASPTWEDALLGYSLFFDIKYNFMKRPLLVSGNVGFFRAGAWPFESKLDIRGIHPTLLFGSERVYGGIGWNYLIFREEHGIIRQSSKEPSIRVLVGTSLTKWKFQINPELNFYFRLPAHNSETILYSYPFFVAGFGLQYLFGSKK
ncbi:MAG: hypothetical protein IIA61_04575 [Candidatus Marinimicrobia bacterium]|nr:hypothetical protein [Candidatus Neomarinimicrobiota bacterium]